ncbi:insulinase family protein [Actinoplanes sp. NPDC051861]|uniref:insulinase family protein n=1 Tax=Actinoplanes sp. NPDC051861 TaxID=3155170 RepID=UPI0034328D47
MIQRFDVDGVPALFTPVDGQLHAGLAFRAGLADESLARLGMTHLVEHLALSFHGVADNHSYSAAGDEITQFHIGGSETDVVAFLNGVCAALSDLPLHRLAVERDILTVEQHGRQPSIDEPLAGHRHGARGYGLRGYPEMGLASITPDGVRAWAARFFNRANAVLWIAGRGVPAGLRLALPDGQRQPVPVASSALPVRPAYVTGPDGVLAWNAVVRRRAAAGVFAGVLQRAMFRSLRGQAGISYVAGATHDDRGDGTTVVTATADALPEKQSAVVGGFVDVLATLRYVGADPAEVAAVVQQRCEGLAGAGRAGRLLPGQAADLLTGHPVRTAEEAGADLRTVSAADVREVAAEAWADGLLMAPGGANAGWTGLAAVPTRSPFAVTGTGYPALGDDEIRIVVGRPGVSLISGDEECVTVAFDECAAVLARPDGGRTLIGNDGLTVTIEPTLFENGPAAVARVDAHVHPGLRIDLPARDPDSIPQPPETEECCDDDCCDSDCCDGDCCSDDDCAGECCEQCCDDDCCGSDCRDGDCCSDDGCPGPCCTGGRVGRALRRLRRR